MTGLVAGLKRAALRIVMGLLLVSALTRIVSASLSPAVDEAGEEPVSTTALLCPASEEVTLLLSDIAQRSSTLDARETAVALREQDIAVARQEVTAALQRLQDAEARLAARMAASASAADTDIDQLVRVYEGMKPKDAATLFEAMEPRFAAGFLARMGPGPAAALFTHLSPEKAYALSVLMAGRNANAATE